MDRVLEALHTGAGILWKALWALIFGYLISAAIQVLVTRAQMGRALGGRGPKQAALASFFGFISSSCSFAALAAARSVLVKGAHPVNSLAFLVASTNLVVELGIVLWILLGWQFVVGNFVLGLLMVLYMYLLTRLWFPMRLADEARAHAEERQEGGEHMQHGASADGSWWNRLTSVAGLRAIADAFAMEWKMAYKEILFGFTIAGFIAVFVPDWLWSKLFVGAGQDEQTFWAVLEHAAVAPFVAHFTFIGSMGNVPLAALLWSKQVSFGGAMTFLGADLVAATVVYIHIKYYGARYALFVSALLYVCMVAAGLTVQALFSALGIIPSARPTLQEQVRFAVDYTFWLNIAFTLLAAALLWMRARERPSRADRERGGHEHAHAHG